jgi:hypothetical protein
MTRGVPEPSQWVWSHDTRGDIRAYLGWEAGSKAARHVVVSEPAVAGGQGPVLQDT